MNEQGTMATVLATCVARFVVAVSGPKDVWMLEFVMHGRFKVSRVSNLL